MDIVDVLIMLIPAGMVAFVLFEVGCCMFGEARKPQDGAGEGMPYRAVVVRRRLRRMLFVAAANGNPLMPSIKNRAGIAPFRTKRNPLEITNDTGEVKMRSILILPFPLLQYDFYDS